MNAFAQSRFLVGLCSILLLSMAPTDSAAQYSGNKQASTEVKKAQEEQRLRETALKLDNNCEPGITTSLWLKTLSHDKVKLFWLGQKYAVERTYKAQLQMLRANQIDREADRRIAEINAQRDAAQLAAAGVKQKSSPEFDRAIADAQRTVNQIDANMAQSLQRWAERCYRIADERSR